MIRTEALSFTYPDGTQALAGVTLEVKDDEFLALMGANGCGKTTLLKHMMGLLKPSSGKVWLAGKDLHLLKEEEVFRQVGMVFQDPNDQLFASSVEQDVAFGLINMGLEKDEVARRTIDALILTGVSELSGKAIHTLSFGEKRRVAIAGVLAMQPKIILLDEPTSGLDPRGVSSLMRLLRILNRERRITMVVATHDVELLPLYCDRAVIMNQGRIIRLGTPEEILAESDMVRKAQLRLPRIAHLIEVLQEEDGLNFETRPLTIGQARREVLAFLETWRVENGTLQRGQE